MTIGPGNVVGGYRIERVLGTGGMGTVYLARHPQLPRYDALKVLNAAMTSDREFRTRFEREANLAAALDHPNIVAVYNRGTDHGQFWIAMQYVDGTDAAAAMEHDPRSMTPWRALRITTEVGRGLDHAHRRGLLHRDIKPANFLLSGGDGDEERVLLTDFGVAKQTEDTTELTQAGSFVATIAYASPEQLSGHPLDHRTDIYSLACSFYKMLTGRNPYPGVQPALVMSGHLHEPPPRVTAVDPSMPVAVDEVLAVAMAKDPARRFDTCHEFTTALHQAMHYGVSGLTQQTMPNGRSATSPEGEAVSVPASESIGAKSKSRTQLLVGAAAAIAVALAAGLGAWGLRDGSAVDAASPTATSVAAAPASIADARKQNPAFEGKTVAILDVSGTTGSLLDVAMRLDGTPQSQFFTDLGFTYNPVATRRGNEPDPRPINVVTLGETSLTRLEAGYLLVMRSDTGAGGGGMANLPLAITNNRATVIIVDDPAAVSALRNWSDRSEKTLLERLLPILSKSIK
ncbi:serine/threonine-protein kinase [Nocardia sp. NPDC127526]|uniref:serine/threonine-protein kinase n=1 Tax=Nocardia sp. NPDC127526 TaxID=3345393 RepID=UPI00362CAC1B